MKRIVLAAAAAVSLSGCASIFNGSTQSVVIRSVPEGATASVVNRAGVKVHSGTTPVTLTVNRGAGYFKPEVYKVQLALDGHETKEVLLTSSVSGWYIGNILFGGLIGMLAVDPSTGAMYVFPESVSADLLPAGAVPPAASGSLTVVSTTSLTPEQMRRGQPVAAAASR